MSDQSKIAHQSMKQLTEKIIMADLASRKRKMIYFASVKAVSLLWAPAVLYAVYKILYSQGTFKSVNNQTGDNMNIWKNIFGLNYSCTRQLFRPDRTLTLRNFAQVTAKEVSKDEKIVFKPYIWS